MADWSKIKELLSMTNDPKYDKYKEQISKIEQFAPVTKTLPKSGNWYGAGATPIQTYPEIGAKESALKVANRATFGDLLSKASNQKLIDNGTIPDLKGKNFFGVISETQKFALPKLLSGLGTYGRQLAATTDVSKKFTPTINKDQFNNLSIEEKIKLLANPANNKFATSASGGKIETNKKASMAELKETAKAFGQATINKKGSPYENFYTKNMYEKMYPSFGQVAGWAKNTDDWAKGTNWIQKLGAGLIGTPSAAAGLFTEIAADPVTGLSGGLSKGAKTGLKATDDIITGGKTILPKGAEIGKSALGRKLFDPIIKNEADDILKYLTENAKKGLLDYPAINNAKYAKSLKTNLIKKISEPIIKGEVSKLPFEEAKRLFDFGGLKYMNETVIPGFKFNELANIGKTLSKSTLKDNPLKQFTSKIIKTWQEAFVPSSKFPSEIYPHYQAIQSATKQRISEGAQLIGKITKDNKIKKGDYPLLSDFLGYSKDIQDLNKQISKMTASTSLEDLLSAPILSKSKQKLLDVISEKTAKLKELQKLVPDISAKPNLQKFLADYKDKFLNGFLYDTEKAFGVDYIPKDVYYPQRILKATNDILPNVKDIGRTTAKFQLAQKTPYYRLKELEDIGKVKMKGFLESNLTRTIESAAAIERKELAGVMRTIGKFTPTEGYSLTSLPELKGIYVPDEIIPQLEKVAKPFFGEESAKFIAGIYDKSLGLWKQKALATPGYQFRNFYTDMISGVFEWGTEFLNPVNWKLAVKARAGKPISYVDNFGNTITKTINELRTAGSAGASQTAIEALGKGASSAKYNPMKYVSRLGGAREDLGRIVGHIIETKSGADDIMASSIIKKVFFDYSELTTFERNVMKRVLPFYTWIRKNSVRQLELLTKRTGDFASLSKTLNYANQASDLTDEEKENMPEYFKTDAYVKTPLKTKEGLPLFGNPNFGFQDFARMFSGQDMLSAITPAAKIPVEMIGNKEIFSGNPIRTENFGKQYPIDYQKEAPKFLQFASKFDNELLNNVGLAKRDDGTIMMSDMFAYGLKQVPTFYTAQRMFPNKEQAKTPYDWLSILGGIKLTPLDVNREKTKKLNQLQNDLNSAIDEFNKLNPTNPIPTDTERAKAYKKLALDYIYKKYNMEKVDKLEGILDTTGSNKNINLLMTIKKQPYNAEKKQISDMTIDALERYLKNMGIDTSMQGISKFTQQ